MPVFQEIKLAWRDEEFVIAPDRVMKAIAIVEDQVTLSELWAMKSTGKVKITRIAYAFAALLRFAGVKVSDEEAYESMFGGGAGQLRAIDSLDALLSLTIPPSLLSAEKDTPKGNSAAASGSPS